MKKTVTTEYVTDVEHAQGCWKQNDRSALYLDRITHETQPALFEEVGGEAQIFADVEWKFEEFWKPHRLRCSGCDAERYVAIDIQNNVVAMTPENCPRGGGKLYPHYSNYDNSPCEYCGYTRGE